MNIGYACINLTLDALGVSTNRGMIKRTWGEQGIGHASRLALQNVVGLLGILDWNVAHGVGVFRVTSELFPWASEYRLRDMPDFREIRATLEECGKRPVRMSTHPGPFNKLAGEGATLENTIVDLEIHSEIFDLMGLPPSHWNKINIHVGGAYGDKDETLRRFAKNFPLLSESLRKRLTVENDDKPGVFSTRELMPLHEAIGIPIVFDYFHHKCYDGGWTEEKAFLAANGTWGDMRPVAHYSSSRRDWEDPTAKKEAHSDWVYEPIPVYGREVDVVLETKMKELSVGQYVEKFGTGVAADALPIAVEVPRFILQEKAAAEKLATKKAAAKSEAVAERRAAAEAAKAAEKQAREKARAKAAKAKAARNGKGPGKAKPLGKPAPPAGEQSTAQSGMEPAAEEKTAR